MKLAFKTVLMFLCRSQILADAYCCHVACLSATFSAITYFLVTGMHIEFYVRGANHFDFIRRIPILWAIFRSSDHLQ